MPPVTPLNRLPRRRNLLIRQMPAEQISTEAGTIPKRRAVRIVQGFASKIAKLLKEQP